MSDKELEQSALAMLMEMNTAEQDALAEVLRKQINERIKTGDEVHTPELFHAAGIAQLQMAMSCWVGKEVELERLEVGESEDNILFGIDLDDGHVLAVPLMAFVFNAYNNIQAAAVTVSQQAGETRSWQHIFYLMVTMLSPGGMLDDFAGNNAVDCLKERFEAMRAGDINQPVYH